MELDEVLQRVLRRYGVLLVLIVIAPILATYAVIGRTAPTYVSTSRVQLTAATPTSATAADSLVSQATAIVTSANAVDQALSEAKVTRDVPTFVRNAISVAGLGTSSSIDVSVTDTDPVVAQKVVTSLVTQLVTSTNQVRLGNLPDMIKSVDAQLQQLAAKRAPLATAAQANPKDPVAQNRLAGIDRLITDLSATRNQLSVQSASAGLATVIDPAQVPTTPQPSQLPQILVLVGLAALVAGLLLVSIVETLRPHVSGISRISRQLRSQPLGHVVVGARGLVLKHGLVRRARLAAHRAGYHTVVVVHAGRVPALDDVVAALDSQLSRQEQNRAPMTVGQPRAASSPTPSARTSFTFPRSSSSAAGSSAEMSMTDLALASVALINGAEPSKRNGANGSDAGQPHGADEADLSVHTVTTMKGSQGAAPGTGNGSRDGGRDASFDHRAGERRVVGVDQLGNEEPHGAAVIAVTRTFAARSDLDEVGDFLEITGWPLLGIVTVSRSRKFWQFLPRSRARVASGLRSLGGSSRPSPAAPAPQPVVPVATGVPATPASANGADAGSSGASPAAVHADEIVDLSDGGRTATSAGATTGSNEPVDASVGASASNRSKTPAKATGSVGAASTPSPRPSTTARTTPASKRPSARDGQSR